MTMKIPRLVSVPDLPPRKLRFSILIALLMAICSACASLPNVEKIVDGRNLEGTTPHFVGARGPLSVKQSQAILARLKKEVGDTDILARHLALEQELAGEPLVVGNKVTLLENGPSTYSSMFEAIDQATDSINLESFTIEADEIGRKFAERLKAKQKQGVQVNIIYDSVGSFGTPKSFFQELQDDGMMVLEFNPINPLSLKKEWVINHRDHRKILVVDGRIAFMGGVNISQVYSSDWWKRAPERGQGKPVEWRDTHIRIEGPVVAQVQQLFMETWKSQKGPPLSPRSYFPPLKAVGKEVVRILDRTPDAPLSLIFITLISAFRNAESSIHLTCAYFAPDGQLLRELEDAARRGVDVRLILPSVSDTWTVLYAGRSHYSDLMEAGVKIYERKNALLHAKTAVIDGVWSTVGSTNLDWRSLLYNDEANAVVIGVDFANEMEAMFQEDIEKSKLITATEWERRPLGERIKEGTARLWERLL